MRKAGRPPLIFRLCLDCKGRVDLEKDAKFWYCEECLKKRKSKTPEWKKKNLKKKRKYNIIFEKDYHKEENQNIIKQWQD